MVHFQRPATRRQSGIGLLIRAIVGIGLLIAAALMLPRWLATPDADQTRPPGQPIDIQITRNGRVHLHGRPAPASRLLQTLDDAADQRDQPPLAISMDAQAPVESLLLIADLARARGLTNLTLQTADAGEITIRIPVLRSPDRASSPTLTLPADLQLRLDDQPVNLADLPDRLDAIDPIIAADQTNPPPPQTQPTTAPPPAEPASVEGDPLAPRAEGQPIIFGLTPTVDYSRAVAVISVLHRAGRHAIDLQPLAPQASLSSAATFISDQPVDLLLPLPPRTSLVEPIDTPAPGPLFVDDESHSAAAPSLGRYLTEDHPTALIDGWWRLGPLPAGHGVLPDQADVDAQVMASTGPARTWRYVAARTGRITISHVPSPPPPDDADDAPADRIWMLLTTIHANLAAPTAARLHLQGAIAAAWFDDRLLPSTHRAHDIELTPGSHRLLVAVNVPPRSDNAGMTNVAAAITLTPTTPSGAASASTTPSSPPTNPVP